MCIFFLFAVFYLKMPKHVGHLINLFPVTLSIGGVFMSSNVYIQVFFKKDPKTGHISQQHKYYLNPNKQVINLED